MLRHLDPLEFIPNKDNSPYPYKTALDCSIVGPIETSKTDKREINCNLMTVQQAPNLELAKNYFAAQVRVKHLGIGNLLKKLHEADFAETNTEATSQVSEDLEEILTEDRRFLDLVITETKKISKYYQLLLPLKISTLSLPNNRKIAKKRLTSLKNQFLTDSKSWSDYKSFIQNLLTKDYSRKSAGAPAERKSWYKPHHVVYNPNKSKSRVVFDCSAKFNDGFMSLNSELMSYPDVTNLLLGVAIRFRQGK